MPDHFGIDISDAAYADIEEATDWLDEHLPHFREEWMDGLQVTINSLKVFPERCPLAPENRSSRFTEEIRQILYGEGRGQYRILFWIDGTLVRIIQVWHSSRRWLHELEDDDGPA